jgi:FAD:protein FMN transferase
MRASAAAWIAAAAVLFGVAGCAARPKATELRGAGLGSGWSVKLAGTAPGELGLVRRGIQERVDDVAHHLSRWEPDSSLNQLNAAPRDDWQAVPAELFVPLNFAISLAADTGGAYDPTVASLVDAWGFGTSGRRYEPPSTEAVQSARERVGFEKVFLDGARGRMRKPAGLQVDLSSMTHGFAVDQVARYLNGLGVQNYLIDVGGEIRASGQSPDGGPWRVAIEMPPAEISVAGAKGRVVSLKNAGVATSGNYRYYFDYNGRRYSHRIDPRTGEPVAHSLASVTVIDPECMRADALATALTVLGPDEGFKYATARGIAALFILRDGDKLAERMTPRFAEYLN